LADVRNRSCTPGRVKPNSPAARKSLSRPVGGLNRALAKALKRDEAGPRWSTPSSPSGCAGRGCARGFPCGVQVDLPPKELYGPDILGAVKRGDESEARHFSTIAILIERKDPQPGYWKGNNPRLYLCDPGSTGLLFLLAVRNMEKCYRPHAGPDIGQVTPPNLLGPQNIMGKGTSTRVSICTAGAGA